MFVGTTTQFSASLNNPAGPEDCTFKPWTNPRARSKFPQRNTAQQAQDEQHAGVQELHDEAHEVVAEFVALLDDSEKQPQQQQPKQQVRPGTAPAASGPQQQQRHARSPGGVRCGSASCNTDLDWDEFIQRQRQFLTHREVKVAAVAAREYDKAPSPEVGWQALLTQLTNQCFALASLPTSCLPGKLQLMVVFVVSLSWRTGPQQQA
jgi:hypothetical protein